MKNIGILLLILSLVIAAILSYGVYNYLESQSVEPVKEEKITFLVASRDLNINEKITEDMIETVKRPKDFMKEAYINNKEDLIGAYVYEKILKGEGFHKDRLAKDNDGKLVAEIKKGHRAVSIIGNQFIGVADLLKPGDYVDVYLFLPEKIQNQEVIYPNLSKLILQNVKILAVKQEKTRAYESGEEIQDRYALTLSVAKDKVESLVLAENIGFLKLALRPLGEKDLTQTYGKAWQELLVDRNLNIRNLFPEYPINNNLYEINQMETPVKDTEEKENSANTVRYHTVSYGDTLMSIARTYYNDEKKYTLIKKANNIGNNNLIICGEKLKIPSID